MYPVAAYPDSSSLSAAYPYGVEVKFNVIFTVTDCAGYTGTYRVSIEDVRYDDDLATPLMMLVEHTHIAERGNCVTSSWPVELEDLLQRGVVRVGVARGVERGGACLRCAIKHPV